MNASSAVALSQYGLHESKGILIELEQNAHLKEKNVLQVCEEQRRLAEYRLTFNQTRHVAYHAAARGRMMQRQHQARFDQVQRSQRQATRWRTRLQADLQSIDRLIHDMPTLSLPEAECFLILIWLMLLTWLARLSILLSKRLLIVAFPS